MAIRSPRASNAPEHHPTQSGNIVQTPVHLTGRRHWQSQLPGKRRTRLRSLLISGAAAMLMAGSSGCSLMSNAYQEVRKAECLDDFMIAHRNKVFAARAWLREKHCFEGRQYLAEFKAGFLQGYADVANGSNGCLPCVAPSQYWGWKYQSPGGQAAIDAWFGGYPLGVKAAEQDGIGHWNRAPMMAHHSPSTNPSADGEHPAAAPVLGPDGRPIPPEVIVPGSTRIYESSAPSELLDYEMLNPPAEILADPLQDARHLDAPALGDGARVNPYSEHQLASASDVSNSIAAAVSLVPRQPAAARQPSGSPQSATIFSLNDQTAAPSSMGDEGFEGIFGSIEMPNTISPSAGNGSNNVPPAVTTSSSEDVIHTASAGDDKIPFKFE